MQSLRKAGRIRAFFVASVQTALQLKTSRIPVEDRGRGQSFASLTPVTNFLFLLVLSASCISMAESPSHVGFYPVQHIAIPQAVKVASQSVFQVLVPTFEGRSFNTYKIPSAAYSALKNNFSRYKNMDPLVQKAIATQLHFCDQQMGKTCDIFLNIQKGTGFLMNGSFWTNAHVIEPYLEGLPRPFGKPLLIFLFNQKGQLVLNPLTDSVYLEKLPILTAKAQQRGTFYSEQSDFVSLRFKKILAPSLKFTNLNDDPVNLTPEDLFIPGYAACTKCHSEDSLETFDALDRSPFPNSTGQGITITRGPRINSFTAADIMDIPLQNLLSLAGHSLIFLESDSRHGMSGAPILNSRGEVLGIYAGGKINLQKGHLRRVSRGVTVQELLN